jgi:hypothetical protein
MATLTQRSIVMITSLSGYATRKHCGRVSTFTHAQANLSIKLMYLCLLCLYSQAYQKLIASQWDQTTIRGLGWSDKEELLVVAEDGTVRRYFGLDGEFTSFSLGNVSSFPNMITLVSLGIANR